MQSQKPEKFKSEDQKPVKNEMQNKIKLEVKKEPTQYATQLSKHTRFLVQINNIETTNSNYAYQLELLS